MAFMEGRIFRGPYSTIFTDTTQYYKIEPNGKEHQESKS